MKTITHPFGTRRSGTVLEIRQKRSPSIIVVKDELGEGHILVGVICGAVSVGDAVTMIFTEGGPTGGFWQLEY